MQFKIIRFVCSRFEYVYPGHRHLQNNLWLTIIEEEGDYSDGDNDDDNNLSDKDEDDASDIDITSKEIWPRSPVSEEVVF